MLVRAALDTDALVATASDGSPPFRAAHRDLIELLSSYGLLVLAGAADREDLTAAVTSLPGPIRKLWTASLGHFATIQLPPPAPIPLSGVADTATLAGQWRDKIRVAFTTESKATSLGLPPTDPSFVDPGSEIEITRMDLPRDSMRIQQAEQLMRADVVPGTARETVWSDRFDELAHVVKSVTIADRYAVIDFFTNDRPDQGAGLRWFLDKLDLSTPVSVHLICQAPSRSSAGLWCSRLSKLQTQLTAGGLQSLTVTLAPHPVFRDEAHCRHVRLGNVAVLLDRGLAMFDQPQCTQSTPCSLGDRRGAQQREHRIEQGAFPKARRRTLW